ncbi:MAG: hypothetical protein KTR22_11570 [Flavobacteriaceae bacterium]|nr:hypothetical protein [Flavobacteriaceae bacterium]
MNEEELEYQMIERYFLDEMSEEERSDFEKKMKEDPEFKERVAMHTFLHQMEDEEAWPDLEIDTEELKNEAALFREEDTVAFAEKLKAFCDTEQPSVPKKGLPWNRKWIGAVAALLLLALFVFYPKEPSLSELYNDYQNWDNLPSLVTKSDASDTLKELEYRFRDSNYEGVIDMADQIHFSANSGYAQASLYVGVAYLELGQYEAAISQFDALINSESLDFHKGFWYQALTYLKKEDKENCMGVLELISENPTYFMHMEAKALLKKLR